MSKRTIRMTRHLAGFKALVAGGARPKQAAKEITGARAAARLLPGPTHEDVQDRAAAQYGRKLRVCVAVRDSLGRQFVVYRDKPQRDYGPAAKA
jgi:hypothetical protein